MDIEPRHRITQTPLSEWIARVPNELAIDAIGLWQIVPVGRQDFGLDGDELIDYVKRTLESILATGAKPVVGLLEGPHYWRVRNIYGDTTPKIIKAVVNEWLASGHDPEPSGVWFALPKTYNERRAEFPETDG